MITLDNGTTCDWQWEPERTRSVLISNSPVPVTWRAPALLFVRLSRAAMSMLCVYHSPAPISETATNAEVSQITTHGGNIMHWRVKQCAGAVCIGNIRAVRDGSLDPVDAFWLSVFYRVPGHDVRRASLDEVLQGLDPTAHQSTHYAYPTLTLPPRSPDVGV